jgi:hypothetical protein
MFRTIISSNAGEAALFRFSTTNTWNAQQVFKAPTTVDAGAIFQGTGTISAIPTVDANAIALFQGTEAVVSHVMWASSGAPNHVYFRRNNGTYASPTAIVNNDVLGSLQWQGRGATTFGSTVQAQIRATASENFTDALKGTRLDFLTTTAGTNSPTLSLSIIGGFASFSGQVVATSYQLDNTVGNTRTLFFRTSNSTRWTLLANANAESGSNAGSNFEITRWSDAQVSLGHIMQATRSSGDITFNGGGGTSTFTNDIIAPFVQVNRPAGNVRPILYRSAGVTRWAMQATATAESGSNVGSDWGLDAHTDAGAYNFTALSISRSSGNATFYNLVNAPQFRISTSNPPASATATGASGMIRWDANYIYVCTATDTWKRVAIATWP